MSEFNHDLGDQIRDTVQHAVDTMNFDHLNKNISESVKSALGEFRSSVNGNNAVQDWVVGGEHATKQSDEKNQTAKNQSTNRSYTNQTNSNRGTRISYGNSVNQAEMWERRKQEAIKRANQMRRSGNNFRKEAENAYKKQTQRNHHYNYGNANANAVARSQASTLKISRKIPGRIAGPMLKSFGFVGGLAAGITAISTLFFSSTAFMISTFFFFASSAIFFAGSRISNRVKRFRQYISYIGDSKYCQVSELASHTGYKNRFVLKDIRKMLRLGIFREGHLDAGGTCLITDKETYKQYLQSESEFEKRKTEEKKIAQASEEKALTPHNDKNADNAELQKTIHEGRDFVREITAANDAIPAEDISMKLSRLEQITSKIFTFVEQHPEQLPELRKFMEYYLPITLKLVNAYKELDAQPVQGTNINSSKKEIVKTLDTINSAFENLLDGLYETTAMDVSSDISVLEALFAQDGLTNNSFGSMGGKKNE